MDGGGVSLYRWHAADMGSKNQLSGITMAHYFAQFENGINMGCF